MIIIIVIISTTNSPVEEERKGRIKRPILITVTVLIKFHIPFVQLSNPQLPYLPHHNTPASMNAA
jgi:hypothetical protein